MSARSFAGIPVVLVVAAMLAVGSGSRTEAAKPVKGKAPINVIPIKVNQIVVDGGQLFAVVAVGKTTIPVPLTVTTTPSGGVCPILNLELAPIHLSLLGLNVDTSAICLSITAYEGGGLLGDLLCGVANLLSGGLPAINLSTAQLQGLTDVLNAGLGAITSSSSVIGASCDILNLALGPVDLTLLGLNVHLDDCDNGPVTVDITATPGGGLLGDLLCNLGDLFRVGAPLTAINAALKEIAAVIRGLIG